MAINCTLFVALGDLACKQSKVTSKTLDTLVPLLNYIATHSDAT